MKKSILVVFLLQFIFAFSHAEMTSEEVAQQKKQQEAQQKADKAYADAQAGMSVFSDSVSSYADRAKAAVGSRWASLSSYVQNKASKASEMLDDDDTDNSAAKTKRAERVQAANREKLKASDAMEKASGGVTKATDAAAASWASAKAAVSDKASAAYASAALSAKDTAMSAYIKSVGLTASFASLSNRYGSVNDAMAVLERNLDRSIMAAYMQEKMRKMLSSDVMCKAAQSCQKNGKSTALISTSDMKSIFPVTSEASVSNSAADSASGSAAKPAAVGTGK